MPVAFDLVAPDGRKFRLVGPDGVTQDQLREKALAAKAQLARFATRATPGQPPQIESVTTTPASDGAGLPDETAPPSGLNLGLGTPAQPGLIGTAVYRGFVRPAQLLSSTLPGASRESLTELRDVQVRAGVPGAAGLPVEPAAGLLEAAGSALSVLTPFVPTLWGAGSAVRWLSDSDDLADLSEAALSLPALVKTGARAGRAVYRKVTGAPVAGGRVIPVVDDVPRADHAGRTPAEVRYLDQRDLAIPKAQAAATSAERAAQDAARVAARAKQADDVQLSLAARQAAHANRLRDAAKGAEEAAAIRALAARNRADAVAKQYAATKAAATERPADAVRTLLGLPPDAPTTRAAGEMLVAAGEERQLLTPAGAEAVGVATARFKAADRTRDAYAAANVAADQAGVVLPLGSATAAEMLDAARTWAERVGKYAAPIERDAVGDILTAVSRGGDLPYSTLNDLHARLSSISMSPRDYAATAAVGKKELTRFKFSIQNALRTLEVSTPDLADAARAARQAAREGEQVRRTAATLLKRTPESAFALMVQNPTHLRRVMQYASVPEQDAYRMAFWSDAVETATDAQGATDIGKLISRWDSLPEESRTLLASGATAEARVAMAELAGGATRVPALERELVAAKALTRRTLADLRDAQRTWTKAAKQAGVPPEKYADYVRTHEQFIAAEKELATRTNDAKRFRAAVAKEQALLRRLGTRTLAGTRPEEHAKSLRLYHGFQAIRSVFAGSPWSAATHGGLAFSLSRHPRLVRDAVALPADTLEWDIATQGLGAALRGWRGMTAPPAELAEPRS